MSWPMYCAGGLILVEDWCAAVDGGWLIVLMPRALSCATCFANGSRLVVQERVVDHWAVL